MSEEVSGIATHARRLTIIKKRDWTTRWLDDESNIDLKVLEQQLQSEGFSVYQWCGNPGQSYLGYIHTQDEVVCVLSGTADVSVSGQVGKVLSGDRLDVPKNTSHSIIVTSDQPLVVLTGMRQ